jgi:RND family efflux transporter MFP subunit
LFQFVFGNCGNRDDIPRPIDYAMFSRILIPVLILAAGFGAWKWLGIPVEEPKPVHQEAQKLKTERLELSLTDFTVVLETQGTIRAHHSTTITPLVAGTIKTVHPCFEDGAFFKEGEVLAELDPADLQAALTAAQSRLARAEAALAQEEARAKQAKLNWEDIGYDEEPSPLVLRVPQLKEANAVVTSARADLDQATRNLERAKIRAPFAGRVKTRLVGLGQAVGATTPLGEVFATDFAEVRLPLSPDQLPFIKLPTREDDASVEVTLTDALGNASRPSGHTWKARIVRTEGALDESSRELFAIARVDDPFGLVSKNPELRIGQPVRAAIRGTVLKDVYVIPRSALRGVNRIYLIDRAKSAIVKSEITPVWSTTDTLVVRDGLQSGDWLAISRLPYAPDGAPVEIIEPQMAAEAPNSRPLGKASGS